MLLNDIAIGLLASISLGGLAIVLFGLMAWYRRSRGKPVQMKPACFRVLLGCIACVAIYGAGYDGVGVGALVAGIFAGYLSLTNKDST